MRRAVRSDYATAPIRQLAGRIAGGSPTLHGRAVAIRNWLERTVQFQRDPAGLEWVMTPLAQLEILRDTATIRGDCDDVAVLGAALGMAIGLRAKFITIGARPQFVHVFTVLGDGHHWWELDITRPWQTIPAALTEQRLATEV